MVQLVLPGTGRTSGNRGEVPVEPIRRAVLGSPLTLSEVAYACGWVRPPRPGETRSYADTARLKRALGMIGSGRYMRPNQAMRQRTALNIIQALGHDPVDYGL